jgi:predicted nucleic acid-binding protein
MMQRKGSQMYVLDSSAVIEILAGTENGNKIITMTKSHPVFVTPFTIFEVARGLKDVNIDVEKFVESNVLNFDKESSSWSATIERELVKIGKKINSIDIFIAAICLANNKTLITLDKDFSVIKDLKVKIL